MIPMGMVGCGSMAKAYLSQMQPLADRMIFTGLVDLDIERARKAATAPIASGAHLSTQLQDILPHVDALVLALPHDLHRDMAITCLDAGKHILLEKPIANTERECLDIIAAADRSGCVVMHGYVMRYVPLVREYCRMIREEVYGKCFHLSIWTEQYTDRSRGDWIGQAARVGGGQLFSHGCHYIDILLHCMGEPIHGTHVGTNLGTPWMEMEGTSNVSIKFASGATGYHFGTWGSRGSKLRYSMQAHCTGGMIELDFRSGDIVLWLDPSRGDIAGMSPEELAEAKKQPQNRLIRHDEVAGKNTCAEMIHFVDCITHGREPETSLRAGLQSLRAIWRMYEGERRGVVADMRGLALDQYSPEPDPFLAQTRKFGYTTDLAQLGV